MTNRMRSSAPGVVFCILAGCVTSEEFARRNGEFDHGPDVRIVYFKAPIEAVRWKCHNQRALACAAYSYDPKGVCFIYHAPNTSETTLEHERLHCRFGRWHS